MFISFVCSFFVCSLFHSLFAHYFFSLLILRVQPIRPPARSRVCSLVSAAEGTAWQVAAGERDSAARITAVASAPSGGQHYVYAVNSQAANHYSVQLYDAASSSPRPIAVMEDHASNVIRVALSERSTGSASGVLVASGTQCVAALLSLTRPDTNTTPANESCRPRPRPLWLVRSPHARSPRPPSLPPCLTATASSSCGTLAAARSHCAHLPRRRASPSRRCSSTRTSS